MRKKAFDYMGLIEAYKNPEKKYKVVMSLIDKNIDIQDMLSFLDGVFVYHATQFDVYPSKESNTLNHVRRTLFADKFDIHEMIKMLSPVALDSEGGLRLFARTIGIYDNNELDQVSVCNLLISFIR